MPAKRKKPKPAKHRASASTKKSVRARAPRARYYSVTRTPDGAAVVLARHPLAKEAVWGWASGESRDRLSFYGTEDEPRASVPVDDRQYRWTLQPSAVDLLCRDIKRTINDPHYYKGAEKTAAKELVRLLCSKTSRQIVLDPFTRRYMETALFDGFENHTVQDIGAVTRKAMKRDCERFQRENAALLNRAYAAPDYSPGRAGYDFWQTRNGAGTGFWDRDLGEVGKALSQAAEKYGSASLYESRGQVHQEYPPPQLRWPPASKS